MNLPSRRLPVTILGLTPADILDPADILARDGGFAIAAARDIKWRPDIGPSVFLAMRELASALQGVEYHITKVRPRRLWL